MMAAIFDFAPALILAEVLTTTEVMASPPKRPLIMLPIPCAFNSVLVLVKRFMGSSLSEASIHSKDSMEATMAMVTATIHTSGLEMPAKLGVIMMLLKSSTERGTGKLTK